jgi:hypothetical protein
MWLTPDQPQIPTRSDHPRQFGHRPVGVKPVERLRHRDRVHAAVRERQGFRRPRHDRHRGQQPPQFAAHARHRLHRNQVGAAFGEQGRQLAGSGRQVDDRGKSSTPKGSRPAVIPSRASTTREDVAKRR